MVESTERRRERARLKARLFPHIYGTDPVRREAATKAIQNFDAETREKGL
jgi:hypothetical protein